MATTKKKPTLGYRMIELLDKKFDELDKDKSGSLSLDELFALSDTGKDDAKVCVINLGCVKMSSGHMVTQKNG